VISMQSSIEDLLENVRVKDARAYLKGYFQGMSGKPCYYLDPQSSHITLRDAARTLGNVARWAGATRTFWSVAAHTLLVAELVKHAGGNDLAYRLALLHDLDEAYLGDIPTPLKRLLPEYKQIQLKWSDEIRRRAGVPQEVACELVGRADLVALEIERHFVRANDEASWEMWGSKEPPPECALPQVVELFAWEAWAHGLNLQSALYKHFPDFDGNNPK
jgi:uncharacterized protein